MTRRRSRRTPARPLVEHPAGPPTVVSLDWDHGHESVLQDSSPGVTGVCLLHPGELGLFPELAERLGAWLERHEVLSGRWVREEPDTEDSVRGETESARELLPLAHDVRHELGPDVEVAARTSPRPAPRAVTRLEPTS